MEGAIHRWVQRLEKLGCEILDGEVCVEQQKRTTKVSVWLKFADGSIREGVSRREDAYVAVGDAFRAVFRGDDPRPRRWTWGAALRSLVAAVV